MFGGKSFIFGGIHEITQELNQLIVYDHNASRGFELVEPVGGDSPSHGHEGLVIPLKKVDHQEGLSPLFRRKNSASPSRKKEIMMKLNATVNYNTAVVSGANSPVKKHATIKKDHSHKGPQEEQKGLSSPTSVSMCNSFIIKNADESFDNYYHSMRKRKQQNHNTSMDGTMTNAVHESKYGIIPDRKPTPRDGHSAVIDSQGYMYVFGGDRHLMPFNDLYMIKLPSK